MKMILVLALFFAHNTYAADFCTSNPPSPVDSKAETQIQKKITEFANKKMIALQADATLSKLLTAKSPVIINWLSKPEHAGKTEVEIAKLWRIYYAKNMILSKYPQDDVKINTEIENLVNTILKDSLKPKFKERMEKLFKTAQEQAQQYITSLKIEKKSEINARIKAIKLYWPTDLKTSRNNAIPLDLIDWGIAYDAVPNEINMGVQALTYPNDETYVAVFAHEIGHSLDSCRWGAFFTGVWPFQKVGECLRTTKSINAKPRDDSKLDQMVKTGKIPADLALGLKQNLTCNKMIYPPIGTQADQLPEAFADWFSIEVVSQIKNINLNRIRTDLCESKNLSPGSSYPSNADRLNLIYRVHPKISLKKDSHYCSIQ